MSRDRHTERERHIQQALAGLQGVIAAHFPSATFSVGPGGENQEGVYLAVRVDLDDPDAVLDLVIEQVLMLQIEEQLPIHVIPLRSLERVERLAAARD